MDKPDQNRTALGKVEVQKKALRIQELSDKLGFAIKQFEKAQAKFEKGEDSYREWVNISKLLTLQIRDLQHFQAVAHHNLGVLHAGRREFRKAEELFKKAIELDPEYGIAHYNLAVVYKRQGDIIKCRECFARAKELGYQPAR